MQAVVYDRFGGDSVLTLRETAVLQPGQGEAQLEMCVRVSA